MNQPIEENESAILKNQTNDCVSILVKSVLGAAPVVGPLLIEIAGVVIPNQRLDRIAKYAVCLEHKLSKLDQVSIRQNLTNENFTDLVEESLRQAARSLSDERREYIASLIANGLFTEDIAFVESKHLLRVLGEINDIEVIWLASHAVNYLFDTEFKGKHQDVLKRAPAFLRAPWKDLTKAALQENYKYHLSQLGLLLPVYDKDTRTGLVATDENGFKLRHYEPSLFGKLLLRHIGLSQ
jgi:hypothetical protein